MINIDLPPLCPVCGGQTRLRETHRAPRGDEFSCFFRCVSCLTDYPRKVSASDIQLAGLQLTPQPKPPVDDGECDPAV